MSAESVSWPLWQRCCWLGLAVAAVLLLGPRMVEHFLPTPRLRDFVQDWASARNAFTGFRIYEKQEVTLPRHLEYQRRPHRFFLEANAHPPTSVLLVLPLGRLDD